jgi:hypothetical protein
MLSRSAGVLVTDSAVECAWTRVGWQMLDVYQRRSTPWAGHHCPHAMECKFLDTQTSIGANPGCNLLANLPVYPKLAAAPIQRCYSTYLSACSTGAAVRSPEPLSPVNMMATLCRCVGCFRLGALSGASFNL